MNRPRICLVSPGHLSSDPRLVKEANSLHQVGFKVRVVVGDYSSVARSLDGEILQEAPWSCVRVGLGWRSAYLGRRLLQHAAKNAVSMAWIPHLSVAMWAHSPRSAGLAKAAAEEPADLYIAHCLAALPAAAIAAQRHNAKLSFDAEDFHIGELSDTDNHATEIAARDCLERTLLPRCHYLTAASPGIAKAYAGRYGVSMQPILNVFPLSEAPASPVRQEGDRMGSEPSLYWFSQTIGPGRGLESILQAMGKMQTPVRLHLRGNPAPGYAEKLQQLARQIGVADRIHLLNSAPPTKMAQLAACHDIGLSLEPGRDANNRICLGNKIFTYLLAGLPILMSRTPAQEEFSQYLGDAALLVDVNEPERIAQTLDKWLSNPAQVQCARATAWELAQKRYNWDVEQAKFLSVVERALL